MWNTVSLWEHDKKMDTNLMSLQMIEDIAYIQFCWSWNFLRRICFFHCVYVNFSNPSEWVSLYHYTVCTEINLSFSLQPFLNSCKWVSQWGNQTYPWQRVFWKMHIAFCHRIFRWILVSCLCVKYRTGVQTYLVHRSTDQMEKLFK